MKRFSIILGTRPEVIKLFSIISLLRRRGQSVQIISTGQHRELIHPLLEFFQITPDFDLNVMTENQGMGQLSERILNRLNLYSEKIRYTDGIVVQGDTVSAWVGAYWAFCHQIPVAHVEAGLRTYDLNAPYPEEGNRQLLSRVARFHFAPTVQAALFLAREGVSSNQIHVVGNPAIDAMNWALQELAGKSPHEVPGLSPEMIDFMDRGPFVLLTAHRRESFGEGMVGICQGVLKALEQNAEMRVIYPVHPNPQVRQPVKAYLEGHSRILLSDPLSYPAFLTVLSRAQVILTDSGGVQEEAPSLRKPILVLRDQTERMEGVVAGFARLVGTNPEKISGELQSAWGHGLSTSAENPYGDGRAAERILNILERG